MAMWPKIFTLFILLYLFYFIYFTFATLLEWLTVNKLPLNIAKTKFILFRIRTTNTKPVQA